MNISSNLYEEDLLLLNDLQNISPYIKKPIKRATDIPKILYNEITNELILIITNINKEPINYK